VVRRPVVRDKNKPNKKRKEPNFWPIPKIWEGQTVFVVGGGPSLLNFDFDRLKGQRIVAINLAFTKLPFAQFCFFADNRFWGWHEAALRQFQHHVVSTARNVKVDHPHYHMIKRNHDQNEWFSLVENIVVGKDSGVQAINLAYHLGAQRTILLGFDMGFKMLTEAEKQDKKIMQLQVPHVPPRAKNRPNMSSTNHVAHWYREHPIPSREQNYQTRFLPQYSQVIKILHGAGRQIFLGTPSAIDTIPQIDLDLVLEGDDAKSICSDQRQAALQVREFHCGAATGWV